MFDKMIARGLLAAAVAAAALTAQADVFNLSNGQTSLQFVPVGDAGNVADTAGTAAVGYPLGAVSYSYSIGTYDVTAAQYTAFLNAVATTSDPYGLYNPNMAAVGGDPNSAGGCGITQNGTPGSYSYSVAATYQNFPVNYINWGDASRFCNWLQNGQPTGGTEGTGTTETGSYTLNGANDDSTLATVTRNPGAIYCLPTESEWYKAAYYVGGGTNAGYYAYPTKNNSAPTAVAPARAWRPCACAELGQLQHRCVGYLSHQRRHLPELARSLRHVRPRGRSLSMDRHACHLVLRTWVRDVRRFMGEQCKRAFVHQLYFPVEPGVVGI